MTRPTRVTAHASARVAALTAVLASTLATSAHAQERVLDDFSDPARWSITATDDVKAALRSADGPHGKALCIDFDFGHVTGYVSVRRALPLVYPARYELLMNVRGDAPPNAFQFKLVDASGENVWWGRRPDYRFPREWTPIKFRQRQIEFAWGPTADRVLRETASAELVIASGSGAGKGSACFDRLTLRQLPDVALPIPAPVIRGDRLSVDFGLPREFGALALHWYGGWPSRYDIEFSDDGVTWRRVRRIDGAQGAVHTHWLPESETRFMRVVVRDNHRVFSFDAVDVLDAATANAFFMQLAKAAPRGQYPRAYIGEQSYWTVLGVDGARTASLLSEDGALEPVPGVGALEPSLIVDKRMLGWADARITHTLRDGDLPMPAVHWLLPDPRGDIGLDVHAFGHGTPDAAQALARYTVRNLGHTTRDVTLALAWRPFQANPPTQFLANPGGASTIEAIEWTGATLDVNRVPRVRPLTPPTRVQIEPLAAGPVADWLLSDAGAVDAADAPPRIVDDAGFASAALRYALRLRPGEQREVMVALPVTGNAPAVTTTSFAAEERRVSREWRERVGRVGISGPPEVADIARTMRTALGHILVNRSGPALQPGARAYARSWIRDGALTSSALLRLGHEDVARDFLRWFAPFQFKNGKVPCCATARGADPVPENDSDGEFAFAAADLWRYTNDAATARAMWPHVAGAVAHMEALRASERTEVNRAPERAAYFGLMPPSISHEGYSDKPAYSYWDDFWAYTGYRSAVELAQGLGLREDAARIASQRDEFLVDLRASLAASTARFKLEVLPGAADRGDVDPTSSTMALSPAGLMGTLPDALVRNTFDRYWRDFEARRADETRGVRHGDGAYTPYEWRNVGAMVRLGERERAHRAMAYFYKDRRPAGWNQWAEVVVRDPREPRFLGDMPHGWVASDQIRSVLDLFAYEHEGEQSLVLGAGVTMEWLSGRGIAIDRLRTPYGALSWSARAIGPREVQVDVKRLRTQPPGGIVLRGPWPREGRVWIDGRAVSDSADAIRIPHTPARVRIVAP